MSRRSWAWILALLVLAPGLALAQPAGGMDQTASTPPSLVDAYHSLADTMLAAQRTEVGLVRAILAVTYGHAEAAMAEAKAKMQAGKDARPEIEKVASLVAQLGNEGDSAVAAIRKTLVEEGHHHHHHHTDEQNKDDYDEGFVLVTKAAKRVFLDASKEIGKLASAPNAAALDAEWQKVSRQYQESSEGARH